MFLSYEYIKFLEYDDKTKEYRWQYKIIDSEFEEIGGAVEGGVEGGAARAGVAVVVAVIDAYEKRGLPVAANLMKAFLWYSKKHGYTVNELITWNRKYNSKFYKYEKEFEKYIILV